MISHLLCAYDSIFFLESKDQNIFYLQQSREEYQLISGQRINFSKSEVVFSSNISVIQKNYMLLHLGVQEVPSHSKYLGLPLTFGRGKADMFNFLVE